MPTIISVKCSSCGASLEIIPGVDHILCNACGSTYLVEHQTKRDYSAISTSHNDNPASVILKKLDVNTVYADLTVIGDNRRGEIALSTPRDEPDDLYSYVILESLKPDADYSKDYIYVDNNKEYRRLGYITKIDFLMMFYSSLSYLTNESFKIVFGHFPLDIHLMKISNRNKSGELFDYYRLSDEEISSLVEVGKLKNYDWWGEKEFRKNNRIRSEKYLGITNELITKYQLSYNDNVTYLRTSTAYYNFQKSKYVWTENLAYKYVDRLLYSEITSNKAALVLGNTKISQINSIMSYEFLKDIAGRLYEYIRKAELRQISERRVYPLYFHVCRDGVCFGENRRCLSIIPFSEFGMKPISDEMIPFLDAILISQIKLIAKMNNSLNWGVLVDKDSFNNLSYCGEFILKCDTYSEAVYKDWNI